MSFVLPLLRLAAPSSCRSFVASGLMFPCLLLPFTARAAHWEVTSQYTGSTGTDYYTHQPINKPWADSATGYTYWLTGSNARQVQVSLLASLRPVTPGRSSQPQAPLPLATYSRLTILI